MALPDVAWTWNDDPSDLPGQDFTSESVMYNALVTLAQAVSERWLAAFQSGAWPIFAPVSGGYPLTSRSDAGTSFGDLQAMCMTLGTAYLALHDGNPIWDPLTNLNTIGAGIIVPGSARTPRTLRLAVMAADTSPWPGPNGWQRKCPREIRSTDAIYCKGPSLPVTDPPGRNLQPVAAPLGGPWITTAYATPAVAGDVARLRNCPTAQVADAVVDGQGSVAYATVYTTPRTPALPATPADDAKSAGGFYYCISPGNWVRLTPGVSPADGVAAMTLAEIVAASIVSDHGPWQEGDYVGTWWIADLNAAMNLMRTTAIGPGTRGVDKACIYSLTTAFRAIIGQHMYVGYPPAGAMAGGTYDDAKGIAGRMFGTNGNGDEARTDPIHWGGVAYTTACRPGAVAAGSSQLVGNASFPAALKQAQWATLAAYFSDPGLTGNNALSRTVDFWVNAGVDYDPVVTYAYSCPAGYPLNTPYKIGTATGTCYDLTGPMLGTEAAPEWPAAGTGNAYGNPTINNWSTGVTGIVTWAFAYGPASTGPLPTGSACPTTSPCGGGGPDSPPVYPFDGSVCCFHIRVHISGGDYDGDYDTTYNGTGWDDGAGATIDLVDDGTAGSHWLLSLTEPAGNGSSGSNTSSGSPLTYRTTTAAPACPPFDDAWFLTSTDAGQTLTLSCWDAAGGFNGSSPSPTPTPNPTPNPTPTSPTPTSPTPTPTPTPTSTPPRGYGPGYGPGYG